MENLFNNQKYLWFRGNIVTSHSKRSKSKWFLDPFTLRRGQHGKSPNTINTLSGRPVMGIKKTFSKEADMI